MGSLFKPEKLDLDPLSEVAAREWKHWVRTFNTLVIRAEKQDKDVDKLGLLINFISSEIYSHIVDAKTFDDAMDILKAIFEKPANPVFARHLLATRKQQNGESLDSFANALKVLTLVSYLSEPRL